MSNLDPKVIVNNYIDRNINNRIIIINKDGSMHVIADISGALKDDFRHMRYFKKYFENYYLEDSNLQKFSKNLNGYSAILYLLAKQYGNILIIDTSRSCEKNEYGCIQLPDFVTKEQRETFNELLISYLYKFNEFMIFSHPILIDGIPDNEYYYKLENKDFNKILDYTEIDHKRK